MSKDANGLATYVLNSTLEELLLDGGDTRMCPRPTTGLNKYGCVPRVRDVVALGSCTASSLTRMGEDTARALLRQWREVALEDEAALVEAVDDFYVHARARLKQVLELPHDSCAVVFCPSGTDAELLALAIARGHDPAEPILNVVTAPAEVGGGTIHAANAEHFNRQVPSGERREPGAPIDGELGEGVRVESIRVRDEHGEPIEQATLDRHAAQLVRLAREDGERVLLHLVCHSKTGVHAPSLERAEALQERWGSENVVVILDAAQGRLGRRTIRAALERGVMVLITGSKFYGGVPFSGALLVPPELEPDSSKSFALSEGMRDYFTAPELPESWQRARVSLPATPNVGLAMRWAIALEHMERYYAIPWSTRREVMRAFERAVRRELGKVSGARLFSIAPPRARASERSLEATTTVFPFFVRAGDRELDATSLKRLCHLLNDDLSDTRASLTASERAVLSRRFHIGQPVQVDDDPDAAAVIRVALGAPFLLHVVEDTKSEHLHPTRMRWMETQLEIFGRKLELILDHLDHFELESA